MPSILVTNDDGVNSPALRAMWRALLDREVGEVTCVVPEREMSAAGKGVTLHKPLRVREIYAKLGRGRYGKAYLVSGTPGDCVMIALGEIMADRPDLVLSGINMGDNITVDNLFTSGTIAGAIQGVLNGIPAVAFSAEIPEAHRPTTPEAFSTHGRVAAEIAAWVLENGLPEGVDLLNVNFPFRISDDTLVRLTRLGWTKFENYILERLDPRGKPYYWIGSNPLSVGERERGTDLYALMVERAISITPIRLQATFPLKFRDRDCELMKKRASEASKRLQDLVRHLKSFLGEVAKVRVPRRGGEVKS